MGRLDPATGKVEQIPLGEGSAPHGVIVGPDGAPWITDGGLNAIVRVDPATRKVTRYPLPADTDNANLNTAAFDRRRGAVVHRPERHLWAAEPRDRRHEGLPGARGARTLWHHGDAGWGHLLCLPRGEPHRADRHEDRRGDRDRAADGGPGRPPRLVGQPREGSGSANGTAGRSASTIRPETRWRSWKLPGENPLAYAVYVDEHDKVWLSDFGGNALVRFDPETEKFDVQRHPRPEANVRQILGRAGEVWAPESGTDTLVMVRIK